MNPSMTADPAELDVSDLSLWKDGPPHEVFRELRNQDLHFSALGDFPHETGFWSVVTYEDIAAVGRDHDTFSSERSILVVDSLATEPGEPDPLDIGAHMLITQDPPRHDRLKALVQRAFTPKTSLDHADRIREIHQPRLRQGPRAAPRRPDRPGPRRRLLRAVDGDRRHARRAA